ncbi:class I SAM-dependent methyltransferase [Streptomyces sp. NPDC001833]|uniref:class I SAM-dependent methyltransferase n=1 Tax=Streptomyces sp. NPDC001833 TaxID=3154658 RepID=UPI00332D7C2B
MPTTSSPHKFEDAAYTEEWVAYNEKQYPQRAVFIEEFVRTLKLQEGALRVLELGGGAGRLAEAIQHECHVDSYDLLDLSPAMRRLARTRLSSSKVTQFVEADFSDAKWPDLVSSEYNAVVTMQAIHELRNPAAVPLLYGQIATVARPGASVVVCDHLPVEHRHRGLYMPPSAHLAAMAAGGLANAEIIRVSDAMVLVRGEVPAARPDADDLFFWSRA